VVHRFFRSNILKGPVKTQLELGIQRQEETDRNFSKGGRSFYFFDFDDNIAVLSTAIFIFHKNTNQELQLSSHEFGEHSRDIGQRGIYKDYEIRIDDEHGSFRAFRDRNITLFQKLLGNHQSFKKDLMRALSTPEHQWQGPSWNCFYHAVYNRRPISLITARGHHPETIKQGISLLVREKHLPKEPNYLSIFPVNYPLTRKQLSQGKPVSVAEMKQVAIRASVEKAFQTYGENPHHRFGMSDDDPNNVELIIDEMTRLKKEFPENSFFVFDTHKGQFIRREVFADGHTQDEWVGRGPEQMSLFNPNTL
jgi:hypothetical protein